MKSIKIGRSETPEYIVEQDDNMRVTAWVIDESNGKRHSEPRVLGIMRDIGDLPVREQIIGKLYDC